MMSIPIRKETIPLWKPTMSQPAVDTVPSSLPGTPRRELNQNDKSKDTEELLELDHEMTGKDKGYTTHEGDDDDADSVSGDISSPPGADHPSRILTKRRIEDNFHFSQWVKDQHTEIEHSVSTQAASDESQSVAWIVRQAESEKIINSPREYQVELFEKAKEKNIIAVLDTGTGKTLIAALLLRHTIGQELEDRKAGNPPRLSFFVVDKVSLAYQQYEVLKCNLDCNIARFYGAGEHSSDTMEYWKKQTEENMIIVCTADILLTCLHRAFVTMAQINLLIFDEAHHTKKNHPYARIIKDFYATLEKGDLRRPRILGMTASPVDSKTRHIDIAAAELEGLLHSDITTVDYTKFNMAIKPPEDTIIRYSVRGKSFQTALWQRLSGLVGKNDIFRNLFAYAEACTQELGQWCADRVWQINLPEDTIRKIEAKMENDFIRDNPTSPISYLDAQRLNAREAYRIVVEYPLPRVKKIPSHVSHKVEVLIDLLEKHFNPATDKCIIFVEKRWTAILLEDLFKQPSLGLKGIRPGHLLGVADGKVEGNHGSLRGQFVTINQFRRGHLNCLLATSIGEEGIDIPDCNMVIRFDPCKTLIQYIQSRGRARHINSSYFHLLEHSNQNHERTLQDLQDGESNLRLFCELQPEDRTIRGNDFDMDYYLGQEPTPTRSIPSTGALLTYKKSLEVLSAFVSSLPHPLDVTYTAEYTVTPSGRDFICEVHLPEASPVNRAVGRIATSKQVAKCSAAYEACMKLLDQGFLDDRLRSTFNELLPAMRNARLALSSKKQAEYVMRIKPEIWSHRGVPTSLFFTIFQLSNPDALGRPSRPLAILTREPLPDVATFPLFFGNQRTSEVRCIPSTTAMNPTPSEIEGLNEFTLRVFRDIFSKEYKSESAKMPYYLAPLLRAYQFDFSRNGISPHELIDWACIDSIQTVTDEIEWEGRPDDIFKDKFVTDPHDGSRKFYTTDLRRDLKPTDPQLPSVPKSQQTTRAREVAKDIWNYSVSLWSNSRSKIPVRHDLPVIEAEFIPLRRNLLDEFEKVDNANLKCYIVLETMKLSALPVDVVTMAYNLPAIIFRLESNLIVLDACRSLGLSIRPDLALEAMTKDSDNTEEHSEEQINFQRGMGKNYERLEFLGDSFLKMSTTIALFCQEPGHDEFFYHVDRMEMVCNQFLFNNALELKLQESIRSAAFNRRVWYPDGLELLKGKKGLGKNVHRLADKTIADVSEAIIGAAYLTTYDQRNFDLAIQAVTKLVNHKNHQMMKFDDYSAAYKTPEWQTLESTAVQEELAKKIANKLGYKFRYPRLLRSAFTHPSYATIWERIPNYQRLEFLGDALLDMVCVDFLFQQYPKADPQWLTEHKMAMVSNQFLGCLCVSLELHTHMVSMHGSMQKEIADYVLAITEARERAEEAALPTKSAYARDFWVEVQKPPKCLPDLVESYMGAIFIDSGFDYDRVREFFTDHIRPYFDADAMPLYDTFASKHPVTHLAHVLQVRLRCDHWRLMAEEVPLPPQDGQAVDATRVVCGILIHGRVCEHAHADSGRYAKPKAAKRLLERLEGMSVETFRREFGCDCRPDEVDAEVEGEGEGDAKGMDAGVAAVAAAHGTAV